jgi:diaminopimelate decarboxylase
MSGMGINRDFARRLIEEFGSPIYVYDLGEAERRAETLFSVLPQGSKLYYSFKANPLPSLARALRESGCRAEISSSGELRAAIHAGFLPSEILYSGPAKTAAEIHEALIYGIRHFSCESFTDLYRLRHAARESGGPAKVLLRVNPAVAPRARLAMTGVESQFGFEEDQLMQRASELHDLEPELEIIGIHVFYGTQITADALVATTENALETASRVSDRIGFPCHVVDAGGGFPWPYAQSGEGPDLTDLKQRYSELFEKNELARSAELWFESGRFLSASSGTLLTTVIDVKQSKGKNFVVLDTGINHLGGMSGLGRIPRPFLTVQPLDHKSDVELEIADIVGPLCSPLDSLARNCKVPPLRPGDLLTIPNAGAYGLTASLLGFLSHPPPLEIAVKNEEIVQCHRFGFGHEEVKINQHGNQQRQQRRDFAEDSVCHEAPSSVL